MSEPASASSGVRAVPRCRGRPGCRRRGKVITAPGEGRRGRCRGCAQWAGGVMAVSVGGERVASSGPWNPAEPSAFAGTSGLVWRLLVLKGKDRL